MEITQGSVAPLDKEARVATRYDDRSITAVDVYSVSWVLSQEGQELPSGSSHFHLTASDGTKFGPKVTVDVAVDANLDHTVAEAEKELLRASHELIQRFAQMTEAELLEAYQASKQPSFFDQST